MSMESSTLLQLVPGSIAESGGSRESCALVSLVGAGPGDPELLTLKAVRCLNQADIVLYDALTAKQSLSHAPHARCYFVGKRAGRASIQQSTIIRLMVSASRRGRRVVRLKCGDPFVLGRGGEEMVALSREGIPFEIVPGVSAAIAAPELSYIPVTHRGVTSGFVVLSGHAEEIYAPLLQGIETRALTLVILMGLKNASSIATLLMERGWSKETPCALLFNAATPTAHQWNGTLSTLSTVDALKESNGDPGTLVIGEAVLVGNQVSAMIHSVQNAGTVSPRVQHG
jgi:uroporphyrin-III C-methyltransferase/precorrin-2 dehydrogenase/sirohydrochlorin ferrochelatase